MGARLRWTIWASGAVAALVATSAGVLASSSESRVSGFEIAATSTDGQFVGSIGGGTQLAGGYFYANVIHQALQEGSLGDQTAICGTGEASSSPTAPSPCASSPGPVSTVTVYLDGRSVTGRFDYASKGIRLLSGTGACPSPQKFSVADTVTFGNPLGSYLFSVTLTHYSYDLFGDCITYSATISGTMSQQRSS